MTRQELVAWVQKHNCIPDPIEGINVTAWSIRFINKSNKAYAYLSTPINDKEVPDVMVKRTCLNLIIPIPPGIE